MKVNSIMKSYKRKVFVGIGILAFLIIIGGSLYWFSFISGEERKEKILMNFLKENLVERYIPSNLIIIHRLTYANRTDGMYNLWGGIWFVNDTKFYVGLHYNLNHTGISDLEIFVFDKNIPEELDENFALNIMKKYFKVIRENVTCKSLGVNVTFCESFWVEEKSKAKKGTVVVSTPGNKFIAMCKYPLGSEEYNFSSCVRI